MMPIASIGNSPQIPSTLPMNRASSAPDAGRTFGQTVSQLIGQVNDMQVVADGEIQQLANGRTDDLHEVVLAVAEADLSFRMLLEIRNRLIDTYQELMRMQV
ncbi:MAG: flagellar hook-basal body complex protein FliE [Planctomycetaceae bacterium]|nr:MAG: flagellar hook-basal body complex protein FliE [Planctomycetaceae bacterium]